jgi:formylmethanofuran dehydrogenase subunit E
MSFFNESNDLAAQLCWGRHYQGDEPCFKPTKIVFHRGLDSEDKVVVEDDGQTDWAAVASRIQALLGHGYDYTTLPCEYCGATEIDDVLHCDECGEPIPHGYERADVDEDGEGIAYCDGCLESEEESGAVEDL